ncbi:MAG TPA: hypothetical protein VG013_22675 [Gemmataceae bacterium]|jgi:hypothetical protein|nr:hypothetical protein [Gemmataceae bacterium]
MHPERRPNPDRSPESLEARLRALPQPPVPADLEARLLATIPAEMPIPQRRWAVWVGAVGALAAACLLAVLAWPERDDKHGALRPGTREPVRRVPVPSPEKSEDSARIAGWVAARRVLDGAETPTFTWPLEETTPIRVSSSIPPDLLD